MAIPKDRNVKTLQQRSFREDPTDAELTEQAVTDQVAHDKLDAIIAGVGGSSDTTADILNITVAVANNEVSQALPANTKGFIIKARNARLQLAYEVGESGTTYVSVPRGTSFQDDNFYANQTLYFQTNIATTVELIIYT